MLAIKDRALNGWSFREFDFYRIPGTTARNETIELYRKCYGPNWGKQLDDQ